MFRKHHRNGITASTSQEEELDLTSEDRDPLIDPAPRNHIVKCRITRNRKGMRGLFPTFFLHMERGDGRKVFLLASRRRVKSTTTSYLISADPANMSSSGAAARGVLHSNMLGTQFRLVGRRSKDRDTDTRKAELAAVLYDQNILGFNGPRLMTVLLPHLTNNKLAASREGLIEQFSSGETGGKGDLLVMRNKRPEWSPESQSYVLNFHGRVTRASVKNFQIVSESCPEEVVMQFGKVGADIFTMDFRYPLCAIQAFGIALSSILSKLACE